MTSIFKITYYTYFLAFLIACTSGKSKEEITIEKVADYFAEATKASILEHRVNIREIAGLANRCKASHPDVIQSIKKINILAMLLDSGSNMLKKITETGSSPAKAMDSYETYRNYIMANRPIFESISDDIFTLFFNPVFDLDQKLLPEKIHTITLSSVEISVIILEDELTSLIQLEMERTSNNLGGC